jgi:hypothetical protein
MKIILTFFAARSLLEKTSEKRLGPKRLEEPGTLYNLREQFILLGMVCRKATVFILQIHLKRKLLEVPKYDIAPNWIGGKWRAEKASIMVLLPNSRDQGRFGKLIMGNGNE